MDENVYEMRSLRGDDMGFTTLGQAGRRWDNIILSNLIDVRLWELVLIEKPTGLKALRVQDFVNQRVIVNPKEYHADMEARRLYEKYR